MPVSALGGRLLDLRFFEIYRNPEYLWLIAEGMAVSAGLTVAAGILGFIFATCLAGVRYWQVPVLAPIGG